MRYGLLVLVGLGTVGCPDSADVGRTTFDEVGTSTDGTDVGTGTTDAGTTDAGTTDAGTTDDGTTDDGTTDDGTTDIGGECGNGVLDGDEECDTGELGDATCQSEGFGGGGLTCTADCTLDTSQCIACGNGIIDGEEECDGADLGDNATCLDLNLGTSMEPLGCNADCTYDYGMCSGCGDAVITDPEECEPAGPLLDKDELGGATCISQGFDDGLLSCAPGCTFDTTSCYICGDAVQQGQEACDGADFGDLTCADFLSPSRAPFDSGSLSCVVDECTVDTANCSLCGDGVVTGAEICEPGVLEGETCGSQGFDDGVLACNADCSGYDTSACTDCGDAVIEGNEQCEGGDLANESCDSLGFAGGGTLACSDTCTFDTGMCTNDFCGDGAVNGNDACDCGNQGADCTAAQLDNQSCVSQGFDGGALACFSPNNCQYDTAGCFTCGDGTINPGEECEEGNLGGETCVSLGFAGGGTLTCDGCGYNTDECVSVPNPYVACVNPNQPITGSGPGIGSPSNINLPAGGTITDVNVSINALHTWPGDLTFRLLHNGLTRYLIQRPGNPASTYGCSVNDYDVILDDEGGGGPVENVCSGVAPGVFSPPSRTPNGALSGFDGGIMGGTWSLVIDDSFAGGDNGTLLEWCVTVSWQ